MKKFAFFTLLSFCVTAIAVTSGNSRSIPSSAYETSIADTTPKTHHTVVKKDAAMHKSTVKKTTKTKKPMSDSTQKK